MQGTWLHGSLADSGEVALSQRGKCMSPCKSQGLQGPGLLYGHAS